MGVYFGASELGLPMLSCMLSFLGVFPIMGFRGRKRRGSGLTMIVMAIERRLRKTRRRMWFMVLR